MAERRRARAPLGGANHTQELETGSFEVRLSLQPGLTPRQEQCFEQALTTYLLERDFVTEGTQLVMTVSSDTRELTTVDQVDLVAWLMASMPVAAVSITSAADKSPSERVGAAAIGLTQWFRADTSDLATPLVLQLYRLGRIPHALVVAILRPPNSPGPLELSHGSRLQR